ARTAWRCRPRYRRVPCGRTNLRKRRHRLRHEGGPSRASSGPHPCSSFGCLFLIGGRNAILRREVAGTGTSGGGGTRLRGRGGGLPAGTGQGRIQYGGGSGPRAAMMKRKRDT